MEQSINQQGLSTLQTVRPLTILVVDDDPLVLMGMVDMLQDLGHAVLQAVSGADALKLLEGQRVDLILSDQSMPMMSGAELAKQIRLRHPDVPIVLMTGYANLPPGIPPDIIRLGKPFRDKDLMHILDGLTGP